MGPMRRRKVYGECCLCVIHRPWGRWYRPFIVVYTVTHVSKTSVGQFREIEIPLSGPKPFLCGWLVMDSVEVRPPVEYRIGEDYSMFALFH